MIPHWEQLPASMRNGHVRPYYEKLRKKESSLRLKRAMDFLLALILTIVLSPIMAGLALWIKLDSRGPVFYRQERITRYGKPYRIFKFRTMVTGADKKGPLVTKKQDDRITKAGSFLRKCRLDELPQLFNVLNGDMSFVGTRPEVKKYVDHYSEEMMATLLLPAGITSRTSILFKDEDEWVEKYQKETGKSVDEVYVEHILPMKMKYNLQYLKKFSFWGDLKIMIDTAFAVIR
ncbi:MAG: sugar transferase [Faecalicatena sp.]|uniref:sugar transferase n=1 Tax=Faecalicatena sp. TaxID=2005360 RepID=UPI00258C10C7|nr:sugar transferase [Faecalicatena sp.]MCI6465942.1 sugar transferase [Faecalicatena sp.]